MNNRHYVPVNLNDEELNHDFSGEMGSCILAIIGDLRFYDDYNIDGIIHDSAASIQNILLGCHIHNIGSCYVSDEGVNKNRFRELLKIKEYEKITALVWLGYYDKVPITPARRNVNEVIEFI